MYDRHVIKFLGWSIANNATTSTVPAIILSLAEHGSLCDIVTKKRRGQVNVSDAQKAKWSKQLGKAISHVHSRGWIHRDIKPDNVLVHRDGDIKLVS